MASSNEYLYYVLDLLRQCDHISYRKMMGEYVLYSKGAVFGGIYDNRFLIKRTPSSAEYNLDEAIPYETGKPMYLVDIENVDEVTKLVTDVVNDLRNGKGN